MRYAISDRNSARQEGFASLMIQAAQLAAESIDIFQLREKDLSAGQLAVLARNVLQAFAGTPTRLLINGRADVAVAVGAHGVHLSSAPDEMTAMQVRSLYAAANKPIPLVTVSCHTLEDVALVGNQPLTAILFGPVFGKRLQGELVVAGSGLAMLKSACLLAAPLPVLALGGLTEENAASCLAAGAAGIAGIRLFQRADPQALR